MEADYVIVGAGSAGCVLANRLTEDPNVRVVLIEAGGRDWNPLIHIPVGFMKLLDHKTLTWGFKPKPIPAPMAGRYPIPVAGSSAALLRSTGSFTSAANPRISTTGHNSAIADGAGTTSYRSSGALNDGPATSPTSTALPAF